MKKKSAPNIEKEIRAYLKLCDDRNCDKENVKKIIIKVLNEKPKKLGIF